MQIFTIQKDDIKGRIDPLFYLPEFKSLLKQFKSGKFESVYLKDYIIECQTGKNIEQVEIPDSDTIPYIRTQNVRRIFPDLEFVSFINKNTQVAKVKINDILFVRVGAGVGDACVISENESGSAISDNVLRIRLKEEINPYYLTIFLDTEIGESLFNRTLKGSGKPVISRENLNQIFFPLPSMEIQNQIVEKVLNAYKIKKQKEDEANNLLKNIDDFILEQLGFNLPKKILGKTYIIYSKIVENNRLDPYYFKPSFFEFDKQLNSSKYDIISFDKLLDSLINGFDYRSFEDEGTHYLKVANIRPYRIDLSKPFYIDLKNNPISKEIYLKKGDLLLTRKGTYGVAVSIKSDCDYIICSEIFKITLKEDVSADFLEIILNSSIGQIQFDRNKIGAIMGSLSQDAVRSILIPCPPKEIQNIIISEVQKKLINADILRKEAQGEILKAKKEVEETLFKE